MWRARRADWSCRILAAAELQVSVSVEVQLLGLCVGVRYPLGSLLVLVGFLPEAGNPGLFWASGFCLPHTLTCRPADLGYFTG